MRNSSNLDIRQISGNREVIDELVEGVRREELICMAGAGVSAPLYPLWGALVEDLVEWSADHGATSSMRDTWLQQALTRPEVVCDRIKAVAGESLFSAKLSSVFGAAENPDEPKFTETQSALADIPFRAILTTNYDRGLINARIENPRVNSTGYVTWQDEAAMIELCAGNFDAVADRPLVHCHGIVGEPSSIVLTDAEYKSAYSNALYKRVFEQWWCAHRLVFVGFGHSDRWLELVRSLAIAEFQLTSDLSVRHITFVPIRQLREASDELRELYAKQFGAKVIFYDSADHHSALLKFLKELPKIRSVDKQSTSEFELGQDWVHETTNDSLYVGRSDEKRILDAYSSDTRTRVISITGLGGQGKTSLVGNWLKNRSTPLGRQLTGLLYWSFYNSSDTERFFKKILQITGHGGSQNRVAIESRASAWVGTDHQKSYCELATEALAKNKLLVVLDGLEVLQESAGANFGAFLNNDLRHFLSWLASNSHSSLIVLTSRFLFSDLKYFEGKSLRTVQLNRLPADQCRQLLVNLGLTNSSDDVLDDIASTYEGHPLALRFFAATLATLPHDDPTKLLHEIRSKTAIGEKTLESKIERLVGFYVRTCPPLNRSILESIAIFRIPVAKSAVLDLVARERDDLSVSEYSNAVNSLRGQGLVVVDLIDGEELVSCHPIVRDTFRTFASSNNSIAPLAADYLSGKPGSQQISSLEEVQPIAAAVQVLAESGNTSLADTLYKDRFKDGRVFYEIPAIDVGQYVTHCMIATEERRLMLTQTEGRDRVVRHLAATGEFSANVGDSSEAENWFSMALKIGRGGSLTNRTRAAERLHLRMKLMMGLDLPSSFQRLRGLASRIDEAPLQPSLKLLSALAAVLCCDNRVAKLLHESRVEDVYGVRDELEEIAVWDVVEAEVYGLSGDHQRAKELAKKALSAADGVNARALRILPLVQLSLAGSPSVTAKKPLKHAAEAVEICEDSHLFLYLPFALNALATALMNANKMSDAFQAIEESIRVSSSRNLQRPHVDALALKAKIVSRDSSYSEAVVQHSLDVCKKGNTLAQSNGYSLGLIKLAEAESEVHQRLGDHVHAEQAHLYYETKSKDLIDYLSKF